MTIHLAFLLLLLLGVSGLIVGALRRFAIWQQGEVRARVKLANLWHIPKRYFVDVHHIVQRDIKAARMHIAFAGGMVALFLLLFVALFFVGNTGFRLLLTAILAVIAVGTVLLLQRRQNKPKQLSYGSYQSTALAAIVLLVGLLLVLWSPYIWFGFVLSALAFLVIFWSGFFSMPLKHMISGALHLAFHPRAERFDGVLSTGLKTADDTALGVRYIHQFDWRQVLSFDACIECGRCESVCPAFASGQPLNPKKIIQDLHLLSRGKNDNAYRGSHHPHRQASTEKWSTTRSLDTVINQDTLYACTTCRACVYECPMMIEHVDAIVDMRRYHAMSDGHLPAQSVQALNNLRQTDNVGGYDNAQRHQCLRDLGIDYAQADKHYDVLLLCGESSFELRGQKTLRDFVKILKSSGVRFALLAEESDVGDLARRLGDEILFQQLAKSMIEKLNVASFDGIVTLDPHIYHTIKNEYPALSGQYAIYHASDYLYQLSEKNALKLKQIKQSISYHDPCYLARYNGVIDAPRALLKQMGVEIKEMTRSGMKSRCCGWGGGSAFSDIKGDQRIPDMRIEDVRETGADCVAVSCPNCMVMLEGVVEPRPQVIDVVSLVATALETNETKEAVNG